MENLLIKISKNEKTLLTKLSGSQFSHSVMSKSLRFHGLQHARLPCPSSTPRACLNSFSLSWWCLPTLSSSVTPSPPAFNLSQHQVILQGVCSSHQVAKIGISTSTSVLPMNLQGWFPLGWIGLISLHTTGLSRVFSNTTVEKHQFFGTKED